MEKVKVEKTCISYDELVKDVKRFRLRKRFDIVCYLLGYCKAITNEEFEYISKLSDDGYLED